MRQVATVQSEPVLLREQRDAIVTLTLNRPKQFNALSEQLLDALQQALDDIAADASLQVVIVAANGRAFCPGHDLKEMRSSEDRAVHQALFAKCSRMMMSIVRLPQPVIAQVQGIATAAGCQLVASCDLAIAAQSARFAVSGINFGLFCATPAVALSRNLQPKHAFGMLLTGEFIDAASARELGLVNKVVADEALTDATRQYAETIRDKAPLAVRTGKEMFYRQASMPLAEAYQYAAQTMACNMDTEDAREGVDAFIEKRKPVWRGC